MDIADRCLVVNAPPCDAPARILLKRDGQVIEWAARDVADTDAGLYRFVSDMAGHGWTALRSGDAIILHPVFDATPHHLGWAA